MQDQDFRRVVEASLHYSRAPGTRAGDVEKIVDYLQSPGSGPGDGVSFASHMRDVMGRYPSSLPAGKQYAFYSGKSPLHGRNVDLAFNYFRHAGGRTGWDTRTRFAAYFDAADAEARDVTINSRFARFLAQNKLGVSPFAAADILRNTMAIANCERYSMHAAHSGRPIIAFVDGARSTDVFARLELPQLLKNPDAVINGYPVHAISGDPLEFVRRSAAELTAMEAELHRKVSHSSGRFISLAEFRREIDPIAGYDAIKQTVFGRPLQAAQAMTFDALATASTHWHLPPPRLGQLPYLKVTPAGAVGLVALAFEARNAAIDGQQQAALGNREAAHSTYQHFGARATGGWIGGALAGAAAGSATGPGVILFVGMGAFAGSEAGDRLANWWDQRKVSHQVDAEGIRWRHTGRAWMRTMVMDLSNDGRDNPLPVQVQATLEKAAELDYRASSIAVQLGLGELPVPQDPSRLPASAGDAPSLHPAAWIRDPASGQWSRNAVVDIAVSGALVHKPEIAGPERAAALNRQAAQVIDDNIRNGPLEYQARYLLAYHVNGWQRFGPVPAAIDPLRQAAEHQLGHDGRLYTRAAGGVWTDQQHRPVGGNLLSELERSREAGEAVRQILVQQIALQPAWQPPTAGQSQRDQLQYSYRINGVELTPDWREAIVRATTRTREQASLQRVPMLHLLARSDGHIAADSAIAHLVDGKVAAITSSREIMDAWKQLRARHDAVSDADGLAPDAASGKYRRADMDTAPEGRHSSPRAPEVPALPSDTTIGHVQARRLDDPRHPGHRIYRSMLGQLDALGTEHGQHSDMDRANLAAALALHAKAAGIDADAAKVIAGKDMRTMFVVGLLQGEAPMRRRAHVDIAAALATPMEESARAIERQHALHVQVEVPDTASRIQTGGLDQEIPPRLRIG